ncbi:hypothetical protein HGRIS_001974 [Hohenbuehelia grisea]|uniref:Uncharacterized protein n=1 Tax=Hohenbuehelia grisea TaxID=104357 RepID=A0ABR3JJ16_9AGAR
MAPGFGISECVIRPIDVDDVPYLFPVPHSIVFQYAHRCPELCQFLRSDFISFTPPLKCRPMGF